MTIWSLDQIKKLKEKYLKAGGEYAEEVEPGGVGLGLSILYDTTNKLKTFIIQEHYLNEWSSGHTVRAYNKMPKKYEQKLFAWWELSK